MGRAVKLLERQVALGHPILCIEVFVAIKGDQVVFEPFGKHVRRTLKIKSTHGCGIVWVHTRSLLNRPIDFGGIVQMGGSKLPSPIKETLSVAPVKVENAR